MKYKLFFLYAFIGITSLLSSAKFLNRNHTNSAICTKACIKNNQIKKSSEKATVAPELFSPLHFISILK